MEEMGSSKTNAFKSVRSRMMSGLVPLAGLIFVVVIFGIFTKGKVFSGKNMMTLINTAFPLMIGAMASIFMYAQGSIDLVSASVYALAAILAARVSAVSPLLSFAVCLGVGLACALLNSWLIALAKVPVFVAQMSFSFAIVGILNPLSLNGSVPVPFSWVAWDSPWLKLVIIIVLGCFLFYLYQFTKIGKYARAIGASKTAARQSGINLGRMLTLSFSITGLAVGLCAFMTLIRTGMASPATGGSFNFSIMIALVLGGIPISGGAAAKFFYAIIGALLLAMIMHGLTVLGLDKNLQQVIQATVFLSVLILADKLNRKNVKA